MHGQAGGFRLRRSSRLRDRKDFLRVQREGARTASRHFVLLRTQRFDGDSEAGARLGITVSRKVAPSIGRSRVKRRLREAFRHERARLAAVDLVVIARRGAAQLSSAETHRELTELLLRGASR